MKKNTESATTAISAKVENNSLTHCLECGSSADANLKAIKTIKEEVFFICQRCVENHNFNQLLETTKSLSARIENFKSISDIWKNKLYVTVKGNRTIKRGSTFYIGDAGFLAVSNANGYDYVKIVKTKSFPKEVVEKTLSGIKYIYVKDYVSLKEREILGEKQYLHNLNTGIVNIIQRAIPLPSSMIKKVDHFEIEMNESAPFIVRPIDKNGKLYPKEQIMAAILSKRSEELKTNLMNTEESQERDTKRINEIKIGMSKKKI